MALYFDVIPYADSDSIIKMLRSRQFIKDLPTSKNRHFKYFDEYFKYVGVRTVVFEYNYIDKDYLEDYSSYYSKCYTKYEKKCCRAHFFKSEFSEEDFKSLIVGNSDDTKITDAKTNYAGFIVFRPIPLTLFGRTCLIPYEKEGDNHLRKLLKVRKYDVNLFGIKLYVKSIAFQEQDKAVSACATSAIWSAFQCTGVLFHHPFHSPYQITKNATNIFQFSDRNFPNKGLVFPQMAHAFKSVELESQLDNYINHDYLKAYIYAFINGSLPLILGVNLKEHQEDGAIRQVGFHAVTVSGYAIDDKLENTPFNSLSYTFFPNKESPLLFLRSSKLKKIYVHDDQLGPYARMNFNKPTFDNMDYYYNSLETHWSELDEKYYHVRAYPIAKLIPLYHKIRIPFSSILNIVQEINIDLNLENVGKKYSEYIQWDIKLTTVSKLKSKLFSKTFINVKSKLKFLTNDLPKYLWTVTAYKKGNKLFTFLFDATDIENGKIFIEKIHYKNEDSILYLDLFQNAKNLGLYNEFSDRLKVIVDSYQPV